MAIEYDMIVATHDLPLFQLSKFFHSRLDRKFMFQVQIVSGKGKQRTVL